MPQKKIRSKLVVVGGENFSEVTAENPTLKARESLNQEVLTLPDNRAAVVIWPSASSSPSSLTCTMVVVQASPSALL